MDSNSFDLVEISDITNDLLLPWLDLYETAFPANERGLISEQLSLLKAKMRGDGRDVFMLAAVNAQQEPLGIIEYELNEALSAALLWYNAVNPQYRGQGLGSAIYRKLISRLDAAGIKTFIFEVELPQEMLSDEDKRLAERRIEFYRRLGAKLLTGISYWQDVGEHVPPTPMHIMVHSFQPADTQEIFDLTKQLFGDAIEQTGPLALL
jgi:GNAT superfamily N-acetyltransferase